MPAVGSLFTSDTGLVFKVHAASNQAGHPTIIARARYADGTKYGKPHWVWIQIPVEHAEQTGPDEKGRMRYYETTALTVSVAWI
jgi:hypothetical protein